MAADQNLEHWHEPYKEDKCKAIAALEHDFRRFNSLSSCPQELNVANFPVEGSAVLVPHDAKSLLHLRLGHFMIRLVCWCRMLRTNSASLQPQAPHDMPCALVPHDATSSLPQPRALHDQLVISCCMLRKLVLHLSLDHYMICLVPW